MNDSDTIAIISEPDDDEMENETYTRRVSQWGTFFSAFYYEIY